jgi:hypothetical protein
LPRGIANFDWRERRLSVDLNEVQKEGPLVVELEVVNIGHAPLAWDRECAAFVTWSVFLADGTEVQPTPVSVVANADRDPIRRFVVLKPGERLKKKVLLSETVHRFVTGVATTGEGDVAIAYEDVVRFEIPPGTRDLRVSVEYSNVGSLDASSFRVYFGAEAIDVGFATGFVQKSIRIHCGAWDSTQRPTGVN